MGGMETINQWAVSWAEFMFIRLLDTTLLFLFAGMLWLIIRRKASAQFGYLLFLLILFKLLMPVQLSIPGLISHWFPAVSVQETMGLFGGFISGGGETNRGSEPSDKDPNSGSELSNKDQSPGSRTLVAPTPSPLRIPAFLMLGWMTGVILLLLYQAWLEWKTRFMMHNTIHLDPKLLPINLQELQHAARIKRKVKWVTNHWVQSPVAYGYFRPMIAVPCNMAQNFTEKQIRWILLHELAHVKRGDAFVLLLQRILLTLFFFHPVIWIINALLNHLREYACDDFALNVSKSSPKECGEGFLGIVMQNNGLPTFNLATHGLINYETMVKRRLMRILANKKKKFNLSRRETLWLLASSPAILLMGNKASSAPMGEWIKADVNSFYNPIPRFGTSIVYDSNREVVLLYGGEPHSVFNISAINNDVKNGTLEWNERIKGWVRYVYNVRDDKNGTWEWNGIAKTWTNYSDVGPKIIHGFGMAYDTNRRKPVISGGLRRDYPFKNAKTWEWDGAMWEFKTAEDTPIGYPAMAYNPLRKTVIRHGGFTNFSRTAISTTSSTKEWNGEQWKSLSDDGPALAHHRMVYDSVRNKMVVFGGIKKRGEISNETWEFDGETWERKAVTGKIPPGRVEFGMVFDSNRGVTVLYGGTLYKTDGFSKDVIYNDMWQWDGKGWTQISMEGNGYYTFIDMAYDSKNNEIVLFGYRNVQTEMRYIPCFTWLFKFKYDIPLLAKY